MSDADAAGTMFRFDNSFARDLEGFYVDWKPESVSDPGLVVLNEPLAGELHLDADALATPAGVAILAGNALPSGCHPLAQAYAGHQFGGFSPQLGDGRAVLLGEVIDTSAERRDVQLKGSGRTPFSRSGDGRSALGPMLREYLVSEAMHALGVPTTRGLAVVTTGDPVLRERPMEGAILTRVAKCHIRVGTFQFFAVRKDHGKVKLLADYCIRRHYPHLEASGQPYLGLFRAVLEAQAQLLAKWMNIGFVHGVMNTDNMTISGETIDYGPCAFLDSYAQNAVFSSIDEGGRYAFGNQPVIAQWNLARFAETLIPVIDEDSDKAVGLLTDALAEYPDRYLHHWLAGMRLKLGLQVERGDDLDLVNGLFSAMDGQDVDFTLMFRRLSDVVNGDAGQARSLFAEPAGFDDWLQRFEQRQEAETEAPGVRAAAMDCINPIYIPRNHKVEEALSAATSDHDFGPFQKLLGVLGRPFDEHPGNEEFAKPAPPDFGPYRTFCGT